MLKSPVFTSKNQIKQLLHTTSIKIPFFISNVPTQNLAMPIQNLHVVQSILAKYPKISSSMVKVYYPIDLLTPKYTLIIYFQKLQQAINMYQRQLKKQIKNPNLTLEIFQSIDKEKRQFNNIFYCKDISTMSGIIFQPNKTYVKNPDNIKLKTIINLVSKLIVLEGLPAQDLLKSKNLPIFAFMDHKSFSIQNIYYRWRVYSYLQGDGDKIYRNQPFQMIQGGTIWYPPHQTSPIKLLNMHQRAYFSELVMKLQSKKYQIQEAMSFAIFNINCAYQIVQILIAWVVENPIAIFYLISDIFFNSALPIYRDIMNQVLPLIIHKIRIQYNKKMSVLQKLQSIIKLWQAKYIFEQQYLNGLIFTLNNMQILELENSIQQIDQDSNLEDQSNIISKCQSYGLPYIFNNINMTKQYIRLYQTKKQISHQIAPASSAYDGENLNEKDISRIRLKNVKVFVCQNTNVGMLFNKKYDQQ